MPGASELVELPLSQFLDRLASGDPTPGGGGAAALGGALAAALISMVCNLTLGKEQFAGVADEVQRLLDDSEAARAALEYAVEADATAFSHVSAAYRLPRGDERERSARQTAIKKASAGAAREPLEVARVCASVLDMSTRLAEIGTNAPRFRILTDLSGPFFTVVTEIEVESLAAWEGSFSEVMAQPWMGDWFGRMMPLVESGSREFYTIVD